MTNGAILPGIDGRSTWARRLRDLVALHVADLGGDQNVSEAERAILRRSSVIIVELERMEKDFASSEDAPSIPELEIYQRMANTMRRLLEAVGLHRRPRDITPPHLRHYLHARAVAVDDVGLTGELNSTGLSPTSSGTGNRTGEAPVNNSVPLESNRDGAE
jgi:hypothetical protein